MRLINTETLELHNFIGDIPAYAILSHRWRPDGEATLQEFEEFLAKVRTSNTSFSGSTQVPEVHWQQGPEELEDRSDVASATSQKRSPRRKVTEKDTDLVTSRKRKRAPDSATTCSDEVDSFRISPGIQKVLDFSRKARFEGYSWGWIDTVCIDKTNNAELSESINSMWKWYEDSGLCMVYLSDVRWYIMPSLKSQDEQFEQFLKSDWFSRGWTLQELLAPTKMNFYDSKWYLCGQTEYLIKSISRATAIPISVLKNPKPLSRFAAAQRMAWVGERRTTREEDLAYCLLGLFDINMELLYGEGGVKAFQRLQIKILEESDDETLLMGWAPKFRDIAVQGELRIDHPSGREIVDRCALTGILAEKPNQFAGVEEISDSTSGDLPSEPLQITSWGIKLLREVREPKNATVRWLENSFGTYQMPQGKWPIILVPLLSSFQSDRAEAHFILVTPDRTSPYGNRWCRVHPLTPREDFGPFEDFIAEIEDVIDLDTADAGSGKREHYQNCTLDLSKQQYTSGVKQVFIRMLWPKDSVIHGIFGHDSPPHLRMAKTGHAVVRECSMGS